MATALRPGGLYMDDRGGYRDANGDPIKQADVDAALGGAKPGAADSVGPAFPKGFPSAAALKAAGVKSAADAQAMSADDLAALDGMDEAKAEKVLAFKADEA